VLIYSAIMSLDGYTADAEGKFDWGAPGEEVLAFLNEVERPIGTYLFGRRMYEVLRYWEDADLTGRSAGDREFASSRPSLPTRSGPGWWTSTSST